jgi:hypothetical protein
MKRTIINLIISMICLGLSIYLVITGYYYSENGMEGLAENNYMAGAFFWLISAFFTSINLSDLTKSN